MGTRSGTTQRGLLGLILLLVIIALGAAGYYYWQYRELTSNLQKLAEQDVEQTVKRAGEIVLLPEGEQPQLATVTDAEAVKQEQPFFTNARNGDKVLIYAQAGKAFLYRPSEHKIIEVGPVTIGDDLQGESITAPQTEGSVPLDESLSTAPSE